MAFLFPGTTLWLVAGSRMMRARWGRACVLTSAPSAPELCRGCGTEAGGQQAGQRGCPLGGYANTQLGGQTARFTAGIRLSPFQMEVSHNLFCPHEVSTRSFSGSRNVPKSPSQI